MMTKQLITSVVLGAAILTAPMSARADEDLRTSVDRLERALRELKTSIDVSASSNADQIRSLKDEVFSLKSRIESNNINNADQIRMLKEDVSVLRNRVTLLSDELRDLKFRIDPTLAPLPPFPPVPPVTSKRIDTSAVPPPAPTMSNLRLVNEFVEEMTIRVNGRDYLLAPGQNLTLQVAPGSYVYQIPRLQRYEQARTVLPGETKVIRIFVQ
jgi:hypothetical protein